MRCSSCYAENSSTQRVCAVCGEATLPLEFCPAGHLMEPGASRCSICHELWPEITDFSGPPLLRGIMWLEGAECRSGDGAERLPFIELRDGRDPVSLTVSDSESVLVSFEDRPDASLKILTRPDGPRFCASSHFRPSANEPAYQSLEPDREPRLGNVSIRLALFDVPDWA